MTDPRSPAPVRDPVGLTIAGTDSGGGAGVHADVHAMAAHNVFPTSVVTAVTAQHSTGVESVHPVPIEEIRAQYKAIEGDFDLEVVKTGMLGTAAVVEWVAAAAEELECPLVVDPVMVAASGDRLLEPDAEHAYRELIGRATIATPNYPEATVLTGRTIDDTADAIAAGSEILEFGAEAVLVKGGHGDGDVVRDVLVTADDELTFDHPRIRTGATHGSGCVMASVIAATLASGQGIELAVRRATDFMQRAIRYHFDVGRGPGAVNPHARRRDEAARAGTAEAVEEAVAALVDADISALVPEVGTNVVGATRFAETVQSTAAVDGRITRTRNGVAPTRGIRFGASGHVARFLLACREHDPALRFAINLRNEDSVRKALDALDGPIARYDRADQPPEIRAREGETMAWAAATAFSDVVGTPIAVTDPGAHGKEPIVKLLADDRDTLVERTLEINDEIT